MLCFIVQFSSYEGRWEEEKKGRGAAATSKKGERSDLDYSSLRSKRGVRGGRGEKGEASESEWKRGGEKEEKKNEGCVSSIHNVEW